MLARPGLVALSVDAGWICEQVPTVPSASVHAEQLVAAVRVILGRADRHRAGLRERSATTLESVERDVHLDRTRSERGRDIPSSGGVRARTADHRHVPGRRVRTDGAEHSDLTTARRSIAVSCSLRSCLAFLALAVVTNVASIVPARAPCGSSKGRAARPCRRASRRVRHPSVREVRRRRRCGLRADRRRRDHRSRKRLWVWRHSQRGLGWWREPGDGFEPSPGLRPSISSYRRFLIRWSGSRSRCGRRRTSCWCSRRSRPCSARSGRIGRRCK
jgi:hypothetical protein